MTLPPSDSRAEPALILVGPLRAGTTLLRLLMANHPKIAAIGEFEESVSQVNDSGWPDIPRYRAWLAQNRGAQMKQYGDLPWDQPYPQIVRAMWSDLASRESKPFVTCTIHSRFDRVREIWPNVKFVFLVRDPRDVARSCMGMGWVGEVTHGAPYWTEPARRWLELRETLGRSEYVEVRYEDLLQEPDEQLDRCCQLLGERFDPQMLSFHERSTYEPLNPSLSEQWRRNMTLREADLIEQACDELLECFRYERSCPSPQRAGMVETLQRRVRNRLGRFRWRCRRYGIGLTLAWAVVKRFPTGSSLRIATKRYLNENDQRNLK